VFATYPFIDEAVGRNPRVARNLHMGDYTNLSVNLNIDVANLPELGVPAEICQAVKDARAQAGQMIDALPGLTADQKKEAKKLAEAKILDNDCNISQDAIEGYVADALDALGLSTAAIADICDTVSIPGFCPTAGRAGNGPAPGGTLAADRSVRPGRPRSRRGPRHDAPAGGG
jgi:phospholipid/cholesterol/gamma-HCH transport system substrate-binding protein